MRNTLQAIARENLRSSGYITHPGADRRTPWIYVNPPRSPFSTTDTVLSVLQRRERVKLRKRPKTIPLKNCLNALFRR